MNQLRDLFGEQQRSKIERTSSISRPLSDIRHRHAVASSAIL
jgi:hypothetical protein